MQSKASLLVNDPFKNKTTELSSIGSSLPNGAETQENSPVMMPPGNVLRSRRVKSDGRKSRTPSNPMIQLNVETPKELRSSPNRRPTPRSEVLVLKFPDEIGTLGMHGDIILIPFLTMGSLR